MAVYSSTRTVLRQALAQLEDDAPIVGVAEAGTTTTVVRDSALSIYDNGHFEGWELYDVTGAAAAWVSAFSVVAGVGEMTLAKALSGMAAGRTYELHEPQRKFSVTQYNQAINSAISDLAAEIMLEKVDETVTQVTDTWEYALPAGFYSVKAIYLETDTAGKFETTPVARSLWRLVNKAAPLISFDSEEWSATNGRKLRIEGQNLQAELALESSLCYLPPNLVLDLAHAYLLRVKGDNAAFVALKKAVLAQVAETYRRPVVGRKVRV